jgi:hypothetical protein
MAAHIAIAAAIRENALYAASVDARDQAFGGVTAGFTG